MAQVIQAARPQVGLARSKDGQSATGLAPDTVAEQPRLAALFVATKQLLAGAASAPVAIRSALG